METETGLMIVGMAGVLYGLGVAFAPESLKEGPGWSRLVIGGAVLLLILLVVLVGIPYVMEES